MNKISSIIGAGLNGVKKKLWVKNAVKFCMPTCPIFAYSVIYLCAFKGVGKVHKRTNLHSHVQ